MTTAAIIVCVLLALAVIATGASPFFFVPIGAIIVGAFVVPFVLGPLRKHHVPRDQAMRSGTPTTREASYEPVQEPTQRD